LWERLFLPPVVASAVAYLATKEIEDIKEKLVAFWALWAGAASALHALLGLPALLLPAYPLLALFTGAFMYYKGVRGLEDKGRAGRG